MAHGRRGHRLWFLLAALLAVAAAPAQARAASPSTVVTMFSEPGEFIGDGRVHVFEPADSLIRVREEDGGWVSLRADGPRSNYTFEFRAPGGAPLQSGVYGDARRATEAGGPGIQISGTGAACDSRGSFEVRDIARTSAGEISRLWVLYEARCGNAAPGLFGEIRYGMPEEAGAALTTTPSVVRWSAGDVGRAARSVPVRVAGAVTEVAIAGPDADQFTVDACTGPACELSVRPVRTRGGAARAWLLLRDAGGGQHGVPLQEFAYNGRTGLVVRPEGEAERRFSFADAAIGASGYREGVGFSVRAQEGLWRGDFVPADGEVIAPGRYADGTRYPFNGSGTGLAVWGPSHGCDELAGEFTVHEAAFRHDELTALSMDFEQRCTDSPGALTGTIEFRAGDTTTPAPWMVSRSAPLDDGTPPRLAEAEPAATSEPTATPVTEVAPAVSASATTTPAQRRLRPRVSVRFARVRGGFAVRRLRVTGLPRGARLQVSCRPIGVETLRPRGSQAGLARLFRGERLTRRTRIRLRVTAPGYAERLIRLTPAASRRGPGG